MSEPGDEVGALLRLGRASEAASRAAEILASDPTNRMALLNGALACSQLGDHEVARGYIGAAVGSSPDDPETFRIAARVELAGGKADIAFDQATRAVTLAPWSASAHRMLAEAAARRGDPKSLAAGRASALEAVRLDPNHAESHNVLGMIESKSGPRRRAAALEAFDRATALEPNEAAYHLNAASMLRRMGRKRDAGDRLVSAGRADPTSDRAIKALRSLAGVGLSVAGVVLVQVIRSVVEAQDRGGPAIEQTSSVSAILGVLLVIGLFAALIVVGRRRDQRGAQDRLSSEARQVLKVDRRLRRRRRS